MQMYNLRKFLNVKCLWYIFFAPLVPVPSVTINAPSNQTVGQSLALESSITTVRGITSRVDIVWSSDGVELKKTINANISLTINDSELYEDAFSIPLLSTSDDGRIIQCKVVIMTNPSVFAINNITLEVTGKFYATLLLFIAIVDQTQAVRVLLNDSYIYRCVCI